MKPYYQDKWVTIYHEDCREVSLENISAIVTDPPYELGFMGKDWDKRGVSFQAETWEYLRNQCLSGSPLLSFGGTRTFHRTACAIEDAGWEIRDTLMWVYGSGFPKSLNIGKAIDYAACREQLTERLGRNPTKDELKEAWEQFRRVTGHYLAPDGHWRDCNNHKPNEEIRNPETHYGYKTSGFRPLDSATTAEAQLWEGYGTALKPAYEPIILAMNPLDGTFAENALKHKVAGLNIDECRIPMPPQDIETNIAKASKQFVGIKPFGGNEDKGSALLPYIQGRFPANFIHDGSQLVMELFPDSSITGRRTIDSRERFNFASPLPNSGATNRKETEYTDNGSAARFFYCAKASKAERGNNNNHPTVKPLALLEYLVKLVKMPEYNLILDPFMGSGTTLLACIKLGIPCIGIDNDEHTCEIATRRCSQEVMELV